ncbi:ECF RNA polymerase sigma factor SigW [bacterium BMS3Abin05]|nr:ECF RNA polymerase sigma factor SigW [bacterium BMS3Abin05]GBE28420.1 ECF RNA polymerase sigma factor SigW [bacterium BMS3Bbin03]HDK36222.1 sigma-70 family RNA polymerase sigma factor [Bacteroidota bacterium]HDZ11778.1 sigma-70 family RNA polymerase sigma factor [Bacteroidota bacterium]
MNASDKQLIQLAIEGNQKAYEELLRKYHGVIYHLIYKMVGNKEETEDLVQETFVKAFHSLKSFKEEFAFSTWLYKIATNHTIDLLRKKKLQTYSLDEPVKIKEGEVNREYPDENYSPEKVLLSGETTEIILRSIEALPEKYRRVINLRHKEDKSYEDISAFLQVPVGTVKARLFRARELLKKELKKSGL